MNMTKLDQIENLLHTLITILQQKLQSNDSYGIVTQKGLLKILQIEGTRTVFYKMKDVIDFLTI